MKRHKKVKRISIVATLFVIIFTIVIAIYQVLSYSADQLEQQTIRSIESNEGRDTHLAVGKNIVDGEFDAVFNVSETLQTVVQNHDVTVINFFASWCTPCQREVPELSALYHELEGSDAAIVGVNIDDNPRDRDAFIETYSVDFPIYEFTAEEIGLKEYRVQLIPTTFFVDNTGNIKRAYIGEVSQNLLKAYIQYVKGSD